MSGRILTVVLAAVLAASCTASVNVDQEKTALMQRDRDWSAATSDIDRFVTFVAADASIYPAGMPVVTGTDGIRKMFTDMSAAQGFSVKWEPEKAQVSTSGDLGYTTGTYEFVSQGVTERGKYVTTWRKDAGEWKVTEDIFNASGPPAVSHLFKPPASVSWGPAPPGLPPGAKLAVLVGDPANPNPFVIRAQVPAGYRVPPHWHPTIENLTILTGTVALGMGETWDDRALTELPPSGYAVMPAESRHFFLAKTAATFQIHGVGPFAITYVNAADDPRQKK